MQLKFYAPLAGLLLLSSKSICFPTEPTTDTEVGGDSPYEWDEEWESFTGPDGSTCHGDNCLRSFLRFEKEAIPFCATYVGPPIVTATVTTVTPTVTVIVTTTVPSPKVDKREEVVVEDEDVALAPPDDSIIFGLVPGTNEPIVAKRATDPLPPFATPCSSDAARISSACSCLSIPTVTIPATFTAPPQTTTVTTTIGIDTRGKCEVGYKAWGNGTGNRVDVLLGLYSAKDCCLKCHARKDCVASTVSLFSCLHLVNCTKNGKEEITAKCPNGLENYPFGLPNKHGAVYPGPCGF